MVFSPHLRYELSKTFRSTRTGREEKGRLLFTYLERYIELGIPCVKQVTDLLREEVKCANAQLLQVECFYRDEEYEREAREIRSWREAKWMRESSGFSTFGPHKCRSSARRARNDRQSGQGIWGRTARRALRCSSRHGCARWGACMRKHITDLFGKLKPRDVKRIAKKILSARRYRLSHALVCADVYLDWRCYCGRPVSKDTADDCYHIENAAYCDLYVTEEASQTEYADEILSTTKVRTYDRGAPLAEWLVSKVGPE